MASPMFPCSARDHILAKMTTSSNFLPQAVGADCTSVDGATPFRFCGVINQYRRAGAPAANRWRYVFIVNRKECCRAENLSLNASFRVFPTGFVLLVSIFAEFNATFPVETDGEAICMSRPR
jgi:hypothetical protein